MQTHHSIMVVKTEKGLDLGMIPVGVSMDLLEKEKTALTTREAFQVRFEMLRELFINLRKLLVYRCHLKIFIGTCDAT